MYHIVVYQDTDEVEVSAVKWDDGRWLWPPAAAERIPDSVRVVFTSNGHHETMWNRPEPVNSTDTVTDDDSPIKHKRRKSHHSSAPSPSSYRPPRHHSSAPSPSSHHSSAPSPLSHYSSAPSPSSYRPPRHHSSAPSPSSHHSSAPSPLSHHSSAPSPLSHYSSAPSPSSYRPPRHHSSAPSPSSYRPPRHYSSAPSPLSHYSSAPSPSSYRPPRHHSSAPSPSSYRPPRHHSSAPSPSSYRPPRHYSSAPSPSSYHSSAPSPLSHHSSAPSPSRHRPSPPSPVTQHNSPPSPGSLCCSSSLHLHLTDEDEDLSLLKNILINQEVMMDQIKIIYKTVQGLQTPSGDELLLSSFPLNDQQSVEEMEAELRENPELHKQLSAALALKGGGSLNECVGRIMAALLTHSLSKQMNWLGVNGKIGFQHLHIKKLVTVAVRRNRLTSKATDKEIDMKITKWLQNASDRNGGRDERRRRRKV
ncbi:extensin-3 [Gambusia affinis]|uniref:extensin-3 n=1 Tax=Gambusia affinis TaxID=33528 RepID=UPI001CDD695B|nr:extensin-3 [Gambusia affinis]